MRRKLLAKLSKPMLSFILQKASKNPSTKWIIVSLHNPLYSSSNTCSANLCQGSKSLRDTYHKLFDKFGVDIVLEGKVHNYQRSFPIEYNPNNPSKPIVSSDDNIRTITLQVRFLQLLAQGA